MSAIILEDKKCLLAPDGAHSKWGPSGAKKWINCLGSLNAARDIPHTSSKYANSGTAAHAVSEVCRMRDVPADEFLGWTVRVTRGIPGTEGYEVSDHVCDQPMVDSVQDFLDYCNDIPAELVLIEETLPYQEYVDGGFGTLDDARLNDDLCTITDFKDGQGVPVYAEKNEQLMLQALAVYLKYRHWFSFKKFVLRICQPRLGIFDSWETTIEEVLHWADSVARPAAIATKDPNAPRTPGSWCTEGFCAARYTCETRAKAMLAHMVGEFEDITEAAQTVKEAEVNAAAMAPADIARCLAVLDQVTAWAKDLKAYAMKEIARGNEIAAPGEKPWKLVESRSKRVYIVAEDELIDELKEEGLTESEIFTRKLISPAKLEKKIGKRHEIMRTCVKKPPGRPKLAPGDDKRPAMESSLIAQFTDLDGEKDEDDDDE